MGENRELHSNALNFCKNEDFFIIMGTLLGNLINISKQFFFVPGANLNFLNFLLWTTSEILHFVFLNKQLFFINLIY